MRADRSFPQTPCVRFNDLNELHIQLFSDFFLYKFYCDLLAAYTAEDKMQQWWQVGEKKKIRIRKNGYLENYTATKQLLLG